MLPMDHNTILAIGIFGMVGFTLVSLLIGYLRERAYLKRIEREREHTHARFY